MSERLGTPPRPHVRRCTTCGERCVWSGVTAAWIHLDAISSTHSATPEPAPREEPRP